MRLEGGDHDAFSVLAAQSVDRLYSTARLILRSDEEAEDAVQDALVRAWLNIRGLRDPAAFQAWLRRLLVNACYKAAGRQHTRRSIEFDAEPADMAAWDGQRWLGERDQLDSVLRRLTPQQRAVLVVRYYLDLSDREASAVLGIPVGTFKSRLNRATSALRAGLDADERAMRIVEGKPA